MAEAAKNRDRRFVQRSLKAQPVGLVAQRLRRQAVRAGDHVVGRDDGVTVDAPGADHRVRSFASKMPCGQPI